MAHVNYQTYPMMCTQCNGYDILLLPEDNNDSIKNIVAIADVAKGSFSYYLEEHFHSKHSREDVVAGLNYDGQRFWLV